MRTELPKIRGLGCVAALHAPGQVFKDGFLMALFMLMFRLTGGGPNREEVRTQRGGVSPDSTNTNRGGGSKIPRFLRTYLMEAPQPLECQAEVSDPLVELMNKYFLKKDSALTYLRRAISPVG